MRRVSGERRDRLIQRELRHGIVIAREQPRGEDAAVRSRPQEGKAGRPGDGAEQVVNHAGDERGLAGMAEPSDGEAHRAITHERRQHRQLIEAKQTHAGEMPGPFTLTRLTALGTLSRIAGEGGPNPQGWVGEGSAAGPDEAAYPGGFIATSSMTLGRISRITPRNLASSVAVAAASRRREPRRRMRAVARPSRPARIVANASAGSIRFRMRFRAASPSAVSTSWRGLSEVSGSGSSSTAASTASTGRYRANDW